jgi:sec-independent protein translocase protein TatA
MWNLGWPEMMVVFVLALLLFGPKKLPEVGKQVAKALGEFRRASNELKDTWHREMAAVERETQEIKKEAEAVAQTTSEYTSDYNNYNYDSSYDYGAYGYPEGGDTTTADASGAVEGGVEVAAGTVAESAGESAAADTAQAAESAPVILAAADTIPANGTPDPKEGSATEPAAR